MQQKSFSYHFNFAMKSLGIPTFTPTLYTSSGATITWINIMNTFFADHGTQATMTEFLITVKNSRSVPTTFNAHLMKTFFAISAAFYAGAVIGSFVYAIGQHTSEHLWVVENEVYKKPYRIVNTRYKNIVSTPQLQNYLKNDFCRDLKIMKCVAAH